MKTTTNDPELAEIRRIRQRIMKECDHDVNKLHAFYEGLTTKRLAAEKKEKRRTPRRAHK